MAQQLEVVKKHINEFLHKYPDIDVHVEKAASKIGTEKAFVVIGAVAIPVLLLLAMGSTTLLIDAIGYGYPMYMTLKALETPQPEDDKQWLTYWLIFSMFKVVESVLGFILELIPFYFIIKVAFLVWCYYPSIMGATTVYNAAVKPYVLPALGIAKEESVGDLGDKPTSYKLSCVLENVTVCGGPEGEETSLQCSISVVPPPERAADKDAMEGVVHNSQTTIVQRSNSSPMNFRAIVTPLKYLDGRVKVVLTEKSTFGSSTGKCLGVVELPVESVGKKVHKAVECAQGESKCLLDLTVEVIKN